MSSIVKSSTLQLSSPNPRVLIKYSEIDQSLIYVHASMMANIMKKNQKAYSRDLTYRM